MDGFHAHALPLGSHLINSFTHTCLHVRRQQLSESIQRRRTPANHRLRCRSQKLKRHHVQKQCLNHFTVTRMSIVDRHAIDASSPLAELAIALALVGGYAPRRRQRVAVRRRRGKAGSQRRPRSSASATSMTAAAASPTSSKRKHPAARTFPSSRILSPSCPRVFVPPCGPRVTYYFARPAGHRARCGRRE